MAKRDAKEDAFKKFKASQKNDRAAANQKALSTPKMKMMLGGMPNPKASTVLDENGESAETRRAFKAYERLVGAPAKVSRPLKGKKK